MRKINYFGGHTDTHVVIKLDDASESVAVDIGFIVFNEHNDPLFSSMLRALKVAIFELLVLHEVCHQLRGQFEANQLAVK